MNRVAAVDPMQKPTDSRRLASRLLLAAWLTWGLSLASVPLFAYLFASFIPPDPSDDFGMGPFLAGAILGAFSSVVLGATALVLHGKARLIRPLTGAFLTIIERLALILPAALVVLSMSNLMGALTVGIPIVSIGLVVIAVVPFLHRRTST